MSKGQGGRASDLKNISLRRNRIGPLGAVALALMIRDYPDSAITMSSLSPSLNTAPSIHDPSGPTLDRSLSPIPYAVRSRRPPRRTSGASDDPALPPIPLVVSSSTGGITTRTLPEGYKPPPPPKHPLVLPGGGNSTMQDGGSFALSPAAAEGRSSNAEAGGASMALSRSVRALDGVERIGRLLTLDLKSNEIKVSTATRLLR